MAETCCPYVNEEHSPCDALHSAVERGRVSGRAESAKEIERLRSMFTEFGKHTNWELCHAHKVYADDDEPEVDHWAVFEVTGPINDREWEEIGGGDTPEAAISAALSRSPKGTDHG